tara:strand:- start:113 stop:367 length:255 start_codon:yes stop_codon:yes gene_type:complete
MNPDTFFFVELFVDDNQYSYGPYLDLQSATLILFDIMPAIANIKAKKDRYVYECKVTEKIIDSKKEWEEISIHVIHNRCIRKKT